jgi:hypothetical protein
MDIGKLKFALATTYGGTTAEHVLQDLLIAFGSLNQEVGVTPGFATIPVSETIAVGQAVQIYQNQLRLADANSSKAAIGVCVNGAVVGQRARIILGMGFATGLSGLTPNSSIYLGNAGGLVYTFPAAGYIQGIGFAISATEMFVTISQPLTPAGT